MAVLWHPSSAHPGANLMAHWRSPLDRQLTSNATIKVIICSPSRPRSAVATGPSFAAASSSFCLCPPGSHGFKAADTGSGRAAHHCTVALLCLSSDPTSPCGARLVWPRPSPFRLLPSASHSVSGRVSSGRAPLFVPARPHTVSGPLVRNFERHELNGGRPAAPLTWWRLIRGVPAGRGDQGGRGGREGRRGDRGVQGGPVRRWAPVPPARPPAFSLRTRRIYRGTATTTSLEW